MQRARAAVALLAVLAIDAPAQDVSGSFMVDVDLSQRADAAYVAQFRVRDGATRQLIAERAIVYSGSAAGPVTVGATAARKCTSDRAQGYCLQLMVGRGKERQASDAFISRNGEMHLAAARIER
jgi:hypothetical protein